ncbi:MAG: hypothetical protein ACRDRE_02430, partial [Pseudonocardiaceae bacterium]
MSAWLALRTLRSTKLDLGTAKRRVPTEAIERAKRDPQSPYEKIAAELRRSILSGDLVYGDLAPTE